MHTRKLRIVKPPLPAVGICEACNSQFKSSKRSQDEAENEIEAAFDDHECKVRDSNQTARSESDAGAQIARHYQTCVRGVFDSDGGG
jgi:hypothetical protein